MRKNCEILAVSSSVKKVQLFKQGTTWVKLTSRTIVSKLEKPPGVQNVRITKSLDLVAVSNFRLGEVENSGEYKLDRGP